MVNLAPTREGTFKIVQLFKAEAAKAEIAVARAESAMEQLQVMGDIFDPDELWRLFPGVDVDKQRDFLLDALERGLDALAKDRSEALVAFTKSADECQRSLDNGYGLQEETR